MLKKREGVKKFMGTFHVIPKEIKEQILKRIKEEGVTVTQAALDHGIATKTIYNWMRNKTVQADGTMEISKLKWENKELLEIIGRLTHNLSRSKKIKEVRKIMQEKKRESKKALAKRLGVSRASLYCQAKRDEEDEEMKAQIQIVLAINPSYGHKRIALEFNLNKKRILRVMKKYDLKPYRRRARLPRKKEDEGREYDSGIYEEFVFEAGMIMSMSRKHSPWENAFQESFYSQFKVDLGLVSRFETVEELIEEIYQTIYYYNNQRIHNSLKMAPVRFEKLYEDCLQKVRQSV